MEEQKKQKKENLSLGKRKIEMDDGPIACNKIWKLTAHGTVTASPPHQKLPHELYMLVELFTGGYLLEMSSEEELVMMKKRIRRRKCCYVLTFTMNSFNSFLFLLNVN
ncbi:hypothetical protein MKX03_031185 [Papaver bracteatum]|nr:hypothetical protein MKX03_031185 [Papaver bracteatum]